MQDVADRAHVGLATIYRRWSTKQELVIAAMSRAKAGVERPETDDPRADLEALLREMTNDIFGPKSCFVVGFITALRSDPELGRVFRESMLAEMRDHCVARSHTCSATTTPTSTSASISRPHSSSSADWSTPVDYHTRSVRAPTRFGRAVNYW